MTSSSQKSLPLRRLVGFTLLTVGLFLGGLELTASGLERFVLPRTRELPSPRPLPFNQLSNGLLKQIAQDRRRLGWPELQYGVIPLGPPGMLGMYPNMHQNEPGALYRTNDVGLRGPNVTPLRPGEVRIMTIGDSSIFGDGVPEAQIFSSVAATRLETDWKRPVSTIIGAIPGHDSQQSRTLLEHYAADFRPGWVVIGNLWSDIYRVDQHEKSLDYEALDALPHQTLTQESTTAVRTNLRRFATYRVLHYLLSPWLTARKVHFITSNQDIGALENGPPTRIPLPRYVENLRAMATLAHSLHARVAFVCLPAPMDLDRAPIPETVRAFRLAMRDVAESAQAPFLDGPRLFAEKGVTLGYFRDQVHPAVEGHALLGEALAHLLLQAGAPPEGSNTYP